MALKLQDELRLFSEETAKFELSTFLFFSLSVSHSFTLSLPLLFLFMRHFNSLRLFFPS